MKKPWYQSLTIVSGIVFSALQAAETMGVAPVGTTMTLAQIVAGLATLIGLRRAQG